MSKFKYFVLAAAFLLLCSVDLLATAQAPDRLVYQGKEYMLYSNPMEAFFKKHPDKKPKSGIMSSGLWRGYVASFEITGQELFLKDIEVMTNDIFSDNSSKKGWKSVLSAVVPGGKKLKVDWFTGLLVVPHGKMVEYIHMGYASTYENYIVIEIDKGDSKRTKEYTHTQYAEFREKQFAAFKQTPEFRQLIEEMLKSPNSKREDAESFLKIFVTEYTSKILVD